MNTPIIMPERLSRLLSSDFRLRRHAGRGVNSHINVCAMQAVGWLAGDADFSDCPDCACPVVTKYVIRLNDSVLFYSHRDDLKPYLPRIVGTRATYDVERRRGFVATDYAVRVFAPIRLRAVGHGELAQELESLPAVTDRDSAIHARDAARKIRAAAALSGELWRAAGPRPPGAAGGRRRRPRGRRGRGGLRAPHTRRRKTLCRWRRRGGGDGARAGPHTHPLLQVGGTPPPTTTTTRRRGTP